MGKLLKKSIWIFLISSEFSQNGRAAILLYMLVRIMFFPILIVLWDLLLAISGISIFRMSIIYVYMGVVPGDVAEDEFHTEGHDVLGKRQDHEGL